MKTMAMTQNFVRMVTDNKEGDYLQFKPIPKEEAEEDVVEHFDVSMFNGYHGTTLAFRTKGIYDLYRVFDDEGNLIIETEDEVVECFNFFPRNHFFTVKAYQKDGAKLIHKATNDAIAILPNRQTSTKYKLSVIVPLYNSELFMCRTIDSILSSSLDKIELILINDGSNDKSLQIAERYANSYHCVRVYDQENQGVSVTRNRGLDLAQGEYVAFCDNDDIIHPLMYETLYDTCKREKTDIAIAQTLIRDDIEKKSYYLSCSRIKDEVVVYDFDEMMKNRGTGGNIFFVAVWNKIVKTDVARQTRFPTGYTGPGVLYEDVAYTSSLYSYIDKFAYNRNALYTWDKRKQKTVGTASTWHSKEDNEYVWKMFIYGFSYMLYHKSGKHLERHDYTHFKRLIESYDKFDSPSPLRTYWDEKLKELITSQKLNENEKIMADKHLAEIVNRFIG